MLIEELPAVFVRRAATMTIDQILELPDSFEKAALEQAWDLQPGNVALKTASGKPMVINLRGSRFIFAAGKSRNVTRADAKRLIRDYGKNGKYRGRDRATGLQRQDLIRMTPEYRERLALLDGSDLSRIDKMDPPSMADYLEQDMDILDPYAEENAAIDALLAESEMLADLELAEAK